MGKLNINRGTTYTINFQYNKNGVAESLVGATVRFTVKTAEYSTSASDADATILKDIIDGTAEGTATITIDPADTSALEPGKYFYDIKVEESGGDIYKCDEGIIKLDASPTNRRT